MEVAVFIIFIITLFTLVITMITIAKGIEKKEEKSIECGLSEFCDIEKNQCTQVKKSSINYLAIAGKLDDFTS